MFDAQRQGRLSFYMVSASRVARVHWSICSLISDESRFRQVKKALPSDRPQP